MGEPNEDAGITHPGDDHTTLGEEKLGKKHATKLVANAALSQATAIQKPSLFTKNMFLVCHAQHLDDEYQPKQDSILTKAFSSSTAVCLWQLSIHASTAMMVL